MTVLLYPNPLKDTDLSVTRRAAALLAGYGVRVLLPDGLGPDAVCQEAQCLPLDQALAQADQVITIGGDGTLLRAAAQCLEAGKPLLGINLGRMGFLATCEMDEMPSKLKRLAVGPLTGAGALLGLPVQILLHAERLSIALDGRGRPIRQNQ